MEKYNTNFSILLKPHGIISPVITYKLNNLVINTIVLDKESRLHFSLDLDQGNNKFEIIFTNKINETPDMAVEILEVEIEGIVVDRFKWASRYYPLYPEPWASQQTEPLPEYQSSATYMGWNGRWELNFEVPIFTWIHQLENLGWIYAPDPDSNGIKRIE
jgi:hypothetical protein